MTVTAAASLHPRMGLSLTQRDRRLLFACLGMVALAAILVAVLAPTQDETDTTPSTFSSGTHGAEAAYLALQQSGYHIERWERSIDDLVPQADTHTVILFADPGFTQAIAAKKTVQQILERGGTVLATGVTGAYLLPDNQSAPVPEGSVNLTGDLDSGCVAQPEGFSPLADSGLVHFRGRLQWAAPRPEQRVHYTCGGNAVVVTYPSGQGQVIWWADSQPLENSFIARDGDLALLVSSLGDKTNRIVWDESLHNDEAGLWSYASGTPVHLLWLQIALVALLLILSFGRRSGPLLPDPIVARDTPLEFVYSLGALYDKAGATNIAVRIAYDRFRLMLGRRARPAAHQQQTEEMVSIAAARLGHSAAQLRETIAACEDLTYAPGQIPPARAINLVRSLNQFEKEIRPRA